MAEYVCRSRKPMNDYYRLVNSIMMDGHDSDDRTGVGTRTLFGEQMRFRFAEGFPLLTGKFVPFKLIASELFWFLEGSTRNGRLKEINGNEKDTIWEEWADAHGELGPIYGAQWRRWSGRYKDHDQIENLIRGLKSDPFSRRHLVSAWNVEYLPDENKSPKENAAWGLMALAPCHVLFQFHVRKLTLSERLREERHRETLSQNSDWDLPKSTSTADVEAAYHAVCDKYGIPRLGLSCKLYQRSADMFLGVPFNIASYSMLTYMIAHLTGMLPIELIWSGGDCHLYKNHFDQVRELMKRWNCGYGDIPKLPALKIVGNVESIDDFTMDNFELIDYEYLPAIKAPVAV